MANTGQMFVEPFYIENRDMLTFSARDLRAFQAKNYVDTFGFYQRISGFYNFMPLRRDNKFVMMPISGSPFVWQPMNSCSWNPLDGLAIGRKELEPCKAEVNAEQCWDEMLDDCFAHLLEYSEGAVVRYTPEGVALFNQFITQFTSDVGQGARNMLASGGMYDVATVAAGTGAIKFGVDIAASQKNNWQATHATCKGWLPLFQEWAAANPAKYGHLNTNVLVGGDFNAAGQFTGSILVNHDALVAAAPRPLRGLVNRGARGLGTGRPFMAIGVLSSALYNDLMTLYNQQSVLAAQNRMRIRKELVPTGDGATTAAVFYIDDTLYIPIDDLNGWDTVLNGETHFHGIIASGNINLGATFSSLDTVANNSILGGVGASQVALAIQQSPVLSDKGKYFMLAQSLFVSSIMDSDYAVGSSLFVAHS